MSNQNVFALDIGTRSVTGIILRKDADTYTIIDFYTKEHQKRSMLDGQIHDVVAVAEVIKEVKNKLEVNHDELHKVSVAAAGRALKTIQATASVNINDQPIVNREDSTFLELSAVQTAQFKLSDIEKNNAYSDYYCVGYSILNYKLDNEVIGSLIDQNGEEASVEVIATFLPKVVVESLLAALHRAGLEMDALTLEPIAAINVLVPESMRRLNIALVDIGAGTSDIAITNQGTVTAYGMVPIAGDKITEAFSDHFLLDFPMAEISKRNIVLNGSDEIEDVLGFHTEITCEELIDTTANQIDALATEITHEIICLNKKAPSAVMLIGGGSLTPGITKSLAYKLGLPESRVAVRGIDAIQSIAKNEDLPTGPEFVTPIGIAIAAEQNPVNYISLNVNNKIIRMFELKQLTIGDCLIQAGIQINKFYGKPGLASMITINGELKTLPGQYGEPPIIYLNGQIADVNENVHDRDAIIIEKGLDGAGASVKLDNIIENETSIEVYYNNTKYNLQSTYVANEQPVDRSYSINDNDIITINHIRTIEDFFTEIVTEDTSDLKPMSVFLNQQRVTFNQAPTKILVNEEPKTPSYILKHNDCLKIRRTHTPTVNDLLKQENLSYLNTINVLFNNQPVRVEQPSLLLKRNDSELTITSELAMDDHIEMIQLKNQSFIFQDVFRYVDLDLSQITGAFDVLINDDPASFHNQIMTGDRLEIKWN